jgi:hypothetical protein
MQPAQVHRTAGVLRDDNRQPKTPAARPARPAHSATPPAFSSEAHTTDTPTASASPCPDGGTLGRAGALRSWCSCPLLLQK